ncbi:hypothetical protein U6K92_12615, partial [Cutibacterium acnes]
MGDRLGGGRLHAQHQIGAVPRGIRGLDRLRAGLRVGLVVEAGRKSRRALHAQARAAGLPVIETWMPQRSENAVYEAAFARALQAAAARWPGLADIAFGDLVLADIRAYRDALCARLGWRAHYPLFGADTARLAREMIAAGLQAHLTCVDTQQLDAGFAGRAFDAALLDALP